MLTKIASKVNVVEKAVVSEKHAISTVYVAQNGSPEY
jgi:hypothetical protein